MFYRTGYTHQEDREKTCALIVLTPARSKKLIARAVAVIPEVKSALKKGLLIISRGTTNAFIAEEIVGIKLENKSSFAAGYIAGGELKATKPKQRLSPYVLRDGKPIELIPEEALKEFGPNDVFIKGGNAIDPEGTLGILVASDIGGTIGSMFPYIAPRSSHCISPVGLEKLVPSVYAAANKSGIYRFKYSMGLPTALVPVPFAKVITEIQALEILCNVSSTHIASGGIGGSEGSVVLSLQGSEENIDKAWDLIQSIKDEAPVLSPP